MAGLVLAMLADRAKLLQQIFNIARALVEQCSADPSSSPSATTQTSL
jgi:hypothetical protein